MRGSWLGNSIDGLANQFGSLPAISGMDIPMISTPQRFDELPSITATEDTYQPIPTPQIAAPEYTDPETGMTGTYARPSVVWDAATMAPAGEAPMGQDAFTDPFATETSYSGGGKVGNAGGQWATLDSMNGYITAASAQTGVPPNLIKSMLAREGAFGTDRNVVGLRGDQVYAFNGIFRKTAESYGLDFDRMTHDDAYAVFAMGKVLQQINANNPQLGSWDNVAKYYFAGPNWNNANWGDETGQNTVNNYVYGPTGVITRWKELDSATGYTGGYGSTGTASWDSIVPGGTVADWGVFAGNTSLPYYTYAPEYGMSSNQHTGADIATPRGSTYYAPLAGTVTCAGTGIGQGADGGGCAAFGDTGGGAGRVEIQLDNGAVLIFGHSSAALVQPGQRVTAGQALGKSGTMNSDHIHLEARVRDPSTSSGWRIVDPQSVIGGASPVSAGAGAGSGWEQSLNNLDWNRINAGRWGY